MFVMSRLLAMLHFRYGRLGSYLTLLALCMCLYFYFLVIPFVFYFCPYFGCWRAAFAASCQQGGGSTRTHFCYFLCSLFFSSQTPLFFERESRQKRFSYSATREAAKWDRCEDGAWVTVSPVTAASLLEKSRSWSIVSRPLGRFFLENFCRVKLRLSGSRSF